MKQTQTLWYFRWKGCTPFLTWCMKWQQRNNNSNDNDINNNKPKLNVHCWALQKLRVSQEDKFASSCFWKCGEKRKYLLPLSFTDPPPPTHTHTHTPQISLQTLFLLSLLPFYFPLFSAVCKLISFISIPLSPSPLPLPLLDNLPTLSHFLSPILSLSYHIFSAYPRKLL